MGYIKHTVYKFSLSIFETNTLVLGKCEQCEKPSCALDRKSDSVCQSSGGIPNGTPTDNFDKIKTLYRWKKAFLP